ncbi:hypothetical protein ACTA71_005023 [Dictyostelium dimigraforme]
MVERMKKEHYSYQLFTTDSRFILSGSDDMNIRVWKANSSAPLGILSNREKEKLEYQDKIKEKFKEIPELKTIATHGRVPQFVYKRRYIKNEIHKTKQRRIKNVADNSGKSPKVEKFYQNIQLKLIIKNK